MPRLGITKEGTNRAYPIRYSKIEIPIINPDKVYLQDMLGNSRDISASADRTISSVFQLHYHHHRMAVGTTDAT
jgi:hypothetical protein